MSTPMEWAFKIAAIHPPVEGTWKAEFCREWMAGIAHFVGAACVEAVQAEREACAEIAGNITIDDYTEGIANFVANNVGRIWGQRIAAAIRARTAQGEG